MARNVLSALAWLRGRWHADLSFQDTARDAAISSRFDHLATLWEKLSARLAASDQRLASIESQIRSDESQDLSLERELRSKFRAVEVANGRIESTLAAQQARLQELNARAGEQAQATQELRDTIQQLAEQPDPLLQSFVEGMASLQGGIQLTEQRLQAAESRLTQDIAALCARLEAIDAALQTLTNALSAPEPTVEIVEQPVTLPLPHYSAEDLRAIEHQGLFVVGCARSGTTILADCLNLSHDIHLLYEASFFCQAEMSRHFDRCPDDFAGIFNARHASYGNLRGKGTYVPSAAPRDRTPFDFLNRMRADYRYIGEKIAFGPRPHMMGADWEDAFLDYHGRHFYHSQYVLTVRVPQESLWSMHKLFPAQSTEALFECWLKSLRSLLECYLVFPNVRMVFLERLDARTIHRIAAELRLDVQVPDGMLGRFAQRSALVAGELPPLLVPYQTWTEECASIYEDLRGVFCRDSLRYRGEGHPRDFVNVIAPRIAALLEEIARAETSAAA